LCTKNDIGTGILFVSYISKLKYVSKFEYTNKFKYVSKFKYKVSYINCVVLSIICTFLLDRVCCCDYFSNFSGTSKKTETLVLLILVALVVF